MDFNALNDFQLVATHGGFGKASRASGRSKATLSRRLADLEDALGIRLIERGSHSLELTDAGKLLVARIEGPMREISEAIDSAREGVSAPRGRLRIAAPLLFSQLALGRLAAAFQVLYPNVEIEAVSEDRVIDLVNEQFDVAIRINPRSDSTLVGRCFARDRLVLVAAPSVQRPIENGDTPYLVPAVVMTTYREETLWSVNDGLLIVKPKPVLRLSSLLATRDAVIAGAGASMLPQSIIGASLARGELVSWGAANNETELWVLYTSRRLQSPKVRAFVEFISSQYPDGSFIIS